MENVIPKSIVILFVVFLLLFLLIVGIDGRFESFFPALIGLICAILIIWFVSRYLTIQTIKQTVQKEMINVERYIGHNFYSQEGSIDDINKLKSLIEQNIKFNGDDLEFLNLTLAIAKIYNFLSMKEEAMEYFSKSKKIINEFSFESLLSYIANEIKDKDYSNAEFACDVRLSCYKLGDIKNIPEIYYEKAVIKLKRKNFKSAVNLVNETISRVKDVSASLSFIEVESYLTKQESKCNLLLGDIYQEWGWYSEAKNYYEKVSTNSELYQQAQDNIQKVKGLQVQKLSYIQIVHDILNYKIIHEAPKQAEPLKEEPNVSKGKKKKKEKPKNSKIILESCSANELLEIDGFDSTKAARFVEERSEGKKYYDIETFSADFGLQPHQMIFAMGKLVFPVKPKSKMGRKIDW